MWVILLINSQQVYSYILTREYLRGKPLPLTKAFTQFGRTVIFSALFLYCSFVFGLTDPKSPAHFATLLVRRLALVVIRKFRSFNQQQHWADIATNSQTA